MNRIEKAAEEYMNILPVKAAIEAAIEDCEIEDLITHIKVAYKKWC